MDIVQEHLEGPIRSMLDFATDIAFGRSMLHTKHNAYSVSKPPFLYAPLHL